MIHHFVSPRSGPLPTRACELRDSIKATGTSNAFRGKSIEPRPASQGLQAFGFDALQPVLERVRAQFDADAGESIGHLTDACFF